jgi:hypothetical protein
VTISNPDSLSIIELGVILGIKSRQKQLSEEACQKAIRGVYFTKK